MINLKHLNRSIYGANTVNACLFSWCLGTHSFIRATWHTKQILFVNVRNVEKLG